MLAAPKDQPPPASTQQVAQAPAAQPTPAQVAARAAEAENERRRLAASVQALTADRDKLIDRMASLEQALQDVTGSIKQQTAVPPPAAEPSPVAVRADEPALTPMSANEPNPVAAALPAAPQPKARTSTVTAALPAEPSSSAAVATPTATPETASLASRQAPEPVVEEAEPEFGIDIGGAVSFDGLRALWKSVSNAHADLLADMHPIFIARENVRPRGVELRLIAGPIADAETVARICATLSTARRFCQPAEFEGQTLSLVSPEPEQWPATAVSDRKAQPSAARPGKRSR